MSSAKHNRNSASTSSGGTTKLPKFLQKSANRDRSKSMTDPTPSPSSSTSPTFPETPKTSRRSRFSRGPPNEEPIMENAPHDDDPPIVIDPPDSPASASAPPPARPRTRSERVHIPSGSASDTGGAYGSPGSARITDLPTRLSGWFSHTFSTSTQDLSLPAILAQQASFPPSPTQKPKPNPLLTAARQGKGHLDKAVRYLLDSDAVPDRCMDPIWLLGVQHIGYEPPLPPSTPPRPSSDARRSPPIQTFRSSASTASSASTSSSGSSKAKPDPGANWPAVFYADFTSRVWVTYRSHFQAIRDTTLTSLETEIGENVQGGAPSSPTSRRWWGGEKGWTSDAGWGCMLRTGQSLLANALLHQHLGRDWRGPPHPLATADYATYVQLITWFLDSPSPLCPFSVHRMALAGKDLGKDVGQWFGPSTAAGAIKVLVHAFPACGLGVSVASDSVVYETDVFAASTSSSRHSRAAGWGDRGVLVLVGLRLGLEGVNPVYYNTIKELYTWPQSVGIAGGRPSSSYYFVGSQSDNLFYLDPHHARPAIPLRPPPGMGSPADMQSSYDASPATDDERGTGTTRRTKKTRTPLTPPSASVRAKSQSAFIARQSASPLTHTFSGSSGSSSSASHGRWSSSLDLDVRELGGPGVEGFGETLDATQMHYVQAYSTAELKTFHCDRVRKMPLSGLDPSMLVGFLCKDENDWMDLRRRVADLSKNHKSIFSIQDEPPNWGSDVDLGIGLESMSEPDIDMPEDDDDDEFFDAGSAAAARSPSTSPEPDLNSNASRKGSEVDTEEDAEAPITPGPNRGSFEPAFAHAMKQREESTGSGDIEDDWVDPVTPVSPPEQMERQSSQSSVDEGAKAETESDSAGTKKKKTKKRRGTRGEEAAPQQQHFPFPVSIRHADERVEPLAPEEQVHRRSVAATVTAKRPPQMRTAKAKDGGRTQSGGVRAIPTEDADDF